MYCRQTSERLWFYVYPRVTQWPAGGRPGNWLILLPPLISTKCPVRSSATVGRRGEGRRRALLTPGSCTKSRQNPAITVRRVRMLRTLHLGGPGGKVLQAESKRMKTLPYEEWKGNGKEASSAAKTHRSCWAVTEVPRNSPQHPRPYILHTVLAAYNQRSVQPLVPWW